ncbi:MAG: diguanylate cyclase [Lachnospiraceae bacterium]|nr:diguanylate cyclase [Lachnospiraceae bacterium]
MVFNDEFQGRTEAKWRDKMYGACVAIVIIIFAADFLFYFLNKTGGRLHLSEQMSRIRFIYIPTIINVALLIIAYFPLKNKKLTNRVKNAVISSLLTLICITIMITNYVYTPLLALPALGILVSTLFADKVLTLCITAAGMISVLITFFVAGNDLRYGDPTLVSDCGIAWIIIACAQITSNVIIGYNEDRVEYISKQYHREQELSDMVKEDPLMNIKNRVTVGPTLSDKIRTYTPELPMCLMMLDIDDFKALNEKYGYPSGDEVLVKLGELLIEMENEYITPYRFGGEEILVLMENTGREQAEKMTLDLLERFRNLRFSFNPEMQVTFSAGIKQFEPGIVAGQWISITDTEMFRAKKSGKNCIKSA